MQSLVKWLVFIAMSIYSTSVFSQVGINTATPSNASAIDIVANDKGVLIPKVALTSTSSQSPIVNTAEESLLVYNTATVNDVKEGFYYWSGSRWETLINEENQDIKPLPWLRLSDLSPTATNTDDIYHKGSVSVNSNKTLGKFTVISENSSSSESAQFLKISSTPSDAINFRFLRGRGTAYDDAAILNNNDIIGNLNYQVVTARVSNLPVFRTCARINAKVNGTVSATSTPGKLEFWIERYTSNSNPERKMEISREGRIRINQHGRWKTDNNVSKVLGIDTNGNFKVIARNSLRTMPPNIIESLGNYNYVFTNTETGKTYNLSEQLNHKNTNAAHANVSSVDKLFVGTSQVPQFNSASVYVANDEKFLSPMIIKDCPVYNNNSEAIAAGEQEGIIYRTSEGQLMIVSKQ